MFSSSPVPAIKEVHATCLENERISENCTVHTLDILNKNSIVDVFNSISPDIIYHLAAQSSVAVSWKKPQLTAEINIIGSLNVLEALRESHVCPYNIGDIGKITHCR